MKTRILFGIGILFTCSMMSCEKSYTCTCKEVIDGVETQNNNRTIGFNESDQTQAEWYCNTLETSHTIDNQEIGYNCTLTTN